MVGLSLGEKHFIAGGIDHNIRSDGRERDSYRPILVETSVIPQANGSARVRMGATEVIASVKAELGKPSALHPAKGKVFIHVDCSAVSEPTFELWIRKGSLPVKAALANAAIPRVNVSAAASGGKQPEVDISEDEFLQFDTSGVPVIITLTKVGGHYIMDATSDEESQMSSAVSVSVHRKGLICGLTKRGGIGLDPSVISDMISFAQRLSEQLMTKLDSGISAAEAEVDESWG